MSSEVSEDQPAPKGMRPIWLVLAVLITAAAAIALIVSVSRDSGSGRTPRLFEYTVPEGTGAALDAGKNPDVFPGRLDVHVGDQLVIHNLDTRVVQVGPYTVDRGETLSQAFNRAGSIVGVCTIHISGRVTIVVHA